MKEEGWDDFDENADFLAVAGGDGTVRRVAKALVKRRLLDKQYPIALLPHGTANNIAAGLRIDGEAAELVHGWHHAALKPFDLGKVIGLGIDIICACDVRYAASDTMFVIKVRTAQFVPPVFHIRWQLTTFSLFLF